MSKKQPTYTKEFKGQIVALYRGGKSAGELSREYDLSKTSIYAWAKYAENTDSFKIKDNRGEDEKELIRLRKALKVIENEVIQAFRLNRGNNGQRKLKVVLGPKNIILSRRLIGKIMAKYGLESTYTAKKYRNNKSKVNNETTQNLVNQDLDNRQPMEVVVSDLTYVNVSGKWHYICILLDISRRKIIVFSAGKNKDAALV